MPAPSASAPGGSKPPTACRGALREALASDAPAVIEVVSDIDKDYPPYKFHQPRLP